MAGASIIDIQFDHKAIDAALQQLQTAASNLQPAFVDIGEYLLESTKQRFTDQVDPDGLAWEPLAEKSKARKERNSDKILIEFGALMDFQRPEATSSGVELISNEEYAATHQFGREDGTIPARPFLGINSQDEVEILNIIEDYLIQALSLPA